MTEKEIALALKDISSTGELLEKTLKLAGLVATLFSSRGHELVIVGGAAIEFYTEGAYMSGDIDFCRRAMQPIPPRIEQEIMGSIGASGGPRSWKCGDLFIDILGFMESEARTPLRELETPYGLVRIIPPEQLIVERALVAVYPQLNAEARACVGKLIAACLKGGVPCSWDEVMRLANDSRYDIGADVVKIKKEIEDGLL